MSGVFEIEIKLSVVYNLALFSCRNVSDGSKVQDVDKRFKGV